MKNSSRCISPKFDNGFVGTLYRAYNEHRHLVLRPDDVWLAITTAFGLYINSRDSAEQMRRHFVDFQGKRKLTVYGIGSIYTANWNRLIDMMSDLIEQSSKDDTRQWMEPDFTTTTPVCKTVGQVVMMGVLKNYFKYEFMLLCGLPKVTLEGTLDDWEKLRAKAVRFKTFDTDVLTHWAGLLDLVLEKFVESYKGNVDKDFWGKIAANQFSGSGADTFFGWINIFMPFSETGEYRLSDIQPETGDWGRIDEDEIPPSTIEVPVTINDNGREYDTIFYGGHMISVYNPDDNTIRPSLNWAIVDVTLPPCHPIRYEEMFTKIENNYNQNPRVFVYEE